MTDQPNIPNNPEIDKALKEFETKSDQEHPAQTTITPQSTTTQNHEVEGVKFDTDTEVESYRAIKFYKETVEPKMVKAVIKYSGGAVKNQRQAELILFAFVIVAVAISLYLFFGGTKKTASIPINIQNIDQSKFSQFNK